MHKLYVLCCLYRNYMDLNKKMICFEDQNCQFIMILWYMYIVTLYTHITFSTYGDIFIILNKKMY